MKKDKIPHRCHLWWSCL